MPVLISERNTFSLGTTEAIYSHPIPGVWPPHGKKKIKKKYIYIYMTQSGDATRAFGFGKIRRIGKSRN